jgi:glycosyltransferase involved in cell wall biosynthesis
MFEQEFGAGTPELREQRRRIHALDTAALSAPGLKRYAIGEEVRRRLLDYNGLDAIVLHPATTLDGFRSGPFEHLFLPGRLHRWKRVALVVEAMSHVRAPVRLLLAGTGEDEAALKSAAAGDPRIVFLGRISDEAMRDHYAHALAVPFVPYREDFGLVAIEAFHSGKPVVTCSDAGEPARMTEAFRGGIVCEPDAASIGAAIDRLHADRALAQRLGAQGRAGAAEIRWDRIAGRMLGALGFAA